MARTSSLYYIAPSAVNVVPNCNGTASDLSVNVSRDTKLKVYYPDIADLDISVSANTYLEWQLKGRNRRLNEVKPYTIYARLSKTDHSDGYMVFAAQVQNPATGEYEDPYILSPNTSSSINVTTTDRRGTKHTWRPVPSRQSQSNRTDFWWIKIGTVSVPENGKRTVTVDTGILGTDQYNTQWRLNPDDLPDRPVRIILEDRGAWTDTPYSVYTGPTGRRTPDGTLDPTVAALLIWTGSEPMAINHGDPVYDPYHRESLSRRRWIEMRMSEEYADLTDAELYVRLTQETKGWENENELETSRVWRGDKLWECLAEGTTEAPGLGCADWRVVSGDTTFYAGIYTSNGRTFRNGNIDSVLTMRVWWGSEEVTDVVLADHGYDIAWKRFTAYDAQTEEYTQQPEDLSWTATAAGQNKIHLRRGDMGSGWMRSYRSAMIRATMTAGIINGEVSEVTADFIF